MYQKALSIYYVLTLFVVGAGFFVMQPTTTPGLTAWQDGVKLDLTTAFVQVIGDQPWFGDLELVYDSINNFYEQASSSTITLLTQPETDEDVIYVFNTLYTYFADAVNQVRTANTVAFREPARPEIKANFMTEEPLYNIVPYRTIVRTLEGGQIAGAAYENANFSVNSQDHPWVTIRDNMTGQLYCLAVYNGTVNKYLGSCKYGYR